MRRDLRVYNESNLFTVRDGGVPPAADSDAYEPHLEANARAHRLFGVELASDDELVVRVVVDEDLTQEENDSWTAHHARTLEIPSGELVVGGAFPIAGMEDYFEEFQQTIAVPPGRYRLNVYTPFSGLPNGPTAFDAARGDQSTKAILTSLAGGPLPAWVRYLVQDGVFTDDDSDWEVELSDEEDEEMDELTESLVTFVVQLTRDEDGPTLPLGRLPHAAFEEGARLPKSLASIVAEGLPDEEDEDDDE